MKKTKIKSLVLALVIGMQTLIPVTLADFLSVRAYATDTVAGYASSLKSSMLAPGKDIIFVVEKPDFSVVQIPAKADLEGIAVTDLYGLQTKQAGVYKVALFYPGTSDASPQNTFAVYPDQVSKSQSSVASTSQMLEADGDSKAFVTVTLYDAYLNPIKDHQVKLISSRTDDEITAINTGVSDANGRANFKLTSKLPGISVMTAMDVSANVVLQARQEVVFYAPQPKAIGGNFFSTDSLQADVLSAGGGANSNGVLPGPVDHFEIQDLPSTVKVNTDQTLTVVARDKNGNVAKNYTGTILISTPDDDNSILPNNGEYTFKEADQGKFTFNLALRFSKMGGQFLQVLDKGNWKISGQKDVTVNPEQSVTTSDISSSLSIKSPVDGGQFGSNLIVVTGQGDPNINLKIFDDDVKIGDSETDSDGFFSFEAKNLSMGSHTFYVMSGSGQVSKSVSITVDTLPPVLNSILITPDGSLKPGDSFKVSVSSEPNLPDVKIRFQGIERNLLPESGQPGTYSADVVAPAMAGSFPMDVILIDALGNKSELQSQKTILVVSEAALSPPTVQNPEGIPGDSQVLLTWDPIMNYSAGIAGYQVNYGTFLGSLNQALQTQGNATSLKIAGLLNGTQYFFAVKAIDSKGVQSKDASVTIAVTPVIGGEATLPDLSALQPSAPENGGAMPPATLYNNPLMGVASSNTITLSWQAFLGVPASRYKVYFGLNPGQYDDYLVTPDDRSNFAVRDLINGVPYYFAVVAINASGNEISPLSSELQMTPQGAGFQSLSASETTLPLNNSQFSQVPAQEQTGSQAAWIVVLSFIFAGGFFYFHKKRILN